MHDLKKIRSNPAAFDDALLRRNLPNMAEEILNLDEAHRKVHTEVQSLQTERNRLSKEIGTLKAKGEDAEAIISEVAEIKEKMAEGDEKVEALKTTLQEKLSTIPNILADDVPDGADENDNKLLHEWGEKPHFSFAPKEHYELGEALGYMDFTRAAKLAGARFVLLHGSLARLERALAQFMLDTLTQEFGYLETIPPYLVRDEILYGTGQLPKFGEDCFKTTDGKWLIPTSEVPLTNLVAGEIVTVPELPMRFTAWTPCFRSEAGSAGRDTRGMLRQHQFHKAEMVSITHPEHSEEEHERMTKCAETILQRLQIPYRLMVLASGDTGFSAQKTHDLEAWLPGQDTYREISSCSNCGDFQARRMNARFRDDDGIHFLHTLNGSGLAVGRSLIAVMENYQTAEGHINIPEVLKPYMNGVEVITPWKK